MPSTTPNARPRPAAEQIRRPPARPSEAIQPVVAKLKVAQLNCAKRAVAGCDLAAYMLENRVDVALIQEQHSQGATGLPTGFGAMRTFAYTGGDRYTNAAAVVINTSSIEAMPMEEFTNEHGVCVWTKGEIGELIVCSMYCRFGLQIAPYMRYLESVLNAAGTTPVLFGMDANAKSRLWHSKVTPDSRGQLRYGAKGPIIEETLVRNDMVVLNQPSIYYTYSSATGSTDIDLTVGNASLGQYDSNWEVIPNRGVSDHNLIMIELSTQTERTTQPQRMTRYSTRSVDWRQFRERIAMEISANVHPNGSAEEIQIELESCIKGVCETMCRRNEQTARKKPSWWSADLTRARKRARKARKRVQKGRKLFAENRMQAVDLQALGRIHKTLEREYCKLIQAAKSADWKRFVSEVGNRDPWGPVYRFCRGKADTALASIRTPTGPTRTWTASAEQLMSAFCPPTEVAPMDGYNPLEPSRAITMDEVTLAVDRNNPRRAPGLDGVTADIVKQAFTAAPDLFVNLFNRCLEEGRFPTAWKKGKLVAFLKSPDRDKSDVGSYRPITLLPVLGKTFERILVARLHENFDASPQQFGFTHGRSTTDAWMQAKRLVDEITDKYAIGIFVDFRGAFDNIEWPAILRKLVQIGCREAATWLSYFSNRRSCMVGRQDVVWRDVTRGCPQGSICGPAIWNLLMNDLLTDLENAGIRHVAFADDLLLIIGSNSRAALESSSAAAVRIADAWGSRVGVEVSYRKTVAMMLRGNLSNRRPVITIDGRRIACVEAVKYLGVWISEGMFFRRHLKETVARVDKLIMPLKRVLKRSWGLKRKATATWMNALLKPVALYAAPVWYRTCMNNGGEQAMAQIQRIALMAVLRVCRTVSTNAMQVIAGSLPWDLEALKIAVKYKCKNNIPLLTDELITADEIGPGLQNLINQRAIAKWRERWANSQHGAVTREYLPSVGNVPETFDPSMRALFLLTGHGSMNAYLQKHTGHHTSSCLCGDPVEDWRHILGTCRLYDDLRDLTTMGIALADGRIDVSQMLKQRHWFEAFSRFAECVFNRRTALLNEAQ